MGDFATKGVAGSGLGLGIAGTALGVLNSGGLLSNLFGGGTSSQQSQMIDALQAKVAEMNAEKYSNNVALEVYKAAREADAKQNTRFEEIAREIADMRVREAALQGEIATNNANISGQINSVAATANAGITALNTSLACLKQTVDGITATYVPATSVTPLPMGRYNSWAAPTTTTTGS